MPKKFNKMTQSRSQKYLKSKRGMKSKEKISKNKNQQENKRIKYSKIDLSIPQ